MACAAFTPLKSRCGRAPAAETAQVEQSPECNSSVFKGGVSPKTAQIEQFLTATAALPVAARVHSETIITGAELRVASAKMKNATCSWEFQGCEGCS